MQDPFAFYQAQIKKYGDQLFHVKENLVASSVLRVVLFCGIAIGVYLQFGNTKVALGILILGTVLFLYLVSRHSKLNQKRDKLKALIGLNEIEIAVLDRNFHHLPEGDEFKESKHYYSQDIDLFGRGSFYQYMNRTALGHGSEKLADLLKENAIDAIHLKQMAIKELARMPAWRQDFTANALLVKTETPHTVILGWMQRYRAFVPSAMKILPILFSLVSVVLFVLYFLDFISGWIVIGWFFAGLGINVGFYKKINKLSVDTTKIQSTFQQYQRLMLTLEGVDFETELLQQKKGAIDHRDEKASSLILQFSKLLNALDQRNNILIGIFANAFLLRDLHISYAIEKWIAKHAAKTELWLETIAFFDAYTSLGNFAFNHPEYEYPLLTESGLVLSTTRAGHPLLPPERCVLNDFRIREKQFFIITGANMAGKSTFLRTVSLQIVMANLGLPVYGKDVSYTPIKLITSMRTSDSLTDDESYFFSELKRLKFIVEEIKGNRYFIVLDEILKGTNSTDKAIGSRKFVQRLVASRATGIIATHDLSLCEISEELPQIENHYFDAEIVDGELHFDYTFKEGICRNMNASFLLKKMGIVD